MADAFRFLDGEVAATFEAAAYSGAQRMLDGLVARYRESHPEIDERYTRAVISGAMLAIGAIECRRNGFALAEVQRKLAESWERTTDASSTSGGSDG